jgi:hypothetical protein
MISWVVVQGHNISVLGTGGTRIMCHLVEIL